MIGVMVADDDHLSSLWSPSNPPANTVSVNTLKVYSWTCHKGHSWEESVRPLARRKQENRCAQCHSLPESFPDIAAEWDEESNGRPASDFSRASGFEASWICASNPSHRWKARVSARTSGGSGCPACSGRAAEVGVSDLATTHPEIAKEWDYQNNDNLTPQGVRSKSGKIVSWVCLQNDAHKPWKARVANRTVNGSGCPACSGTLLSAENALSSSFPAVAAQFVRSVSTPDLDTDKIHKSSTITALWRCELGHEWISAVYSRTSGGSGCPVCANRVVSAGVNDLLVTHPQIADEWDAELNGKLLPSHVTHGSELKVWWRCASGHSWRASVNSRTNMKSGCKACSSALGASQGESELFTAVADILPEHTQIKRHDRDTLGGTELDILVPDLNVAIEFNGLYWHSEDFGKGRNYHIEKTAAARKAGISLIHVWEDDWRERKEVVMRAIAHRLGATASLARLPIMSDMNPKAVARAGARTLTLSTVKHREAANFLDANHIQGAARATIHMGLRDSDGELRALLSVTRVGNKGHVGDWNIERYATLGVIPGGFTRLLSATERYIGESLTRWVTFADSALSDGGLYRANGFTKEATLAPDYRYVHANKRIHKFNYRISRFRTDPELIFDEGLSESALARLNSIPRIWDAGKVRWVKDLRLA